MSGKEINKAVRLEVLTTIVKAIKDGYTIELNKAFASDNKNNSEAASMITKCVFNALDCVIDNANTYSQEFVIVKGKGK